MNRTIATTLVAASFAIAGSAFAEGPIGANDAFAPQATRAEVQADLAHFKKAGVNPWSISYNPLRHVRSTKTRAEVVGEYLQARGQVQALTGEDSGSAWLQAGGRPPVSDTLAARPTTVR